MSFISYSQNYEDVILWRALKHIEKGFYLDVGAMDPTNDSVTKAFYDAGWRGINIEPVQEWYDRLVTQRPGDINLQMVCGDKSGSVDFYEVVDTGLSTLHRELVFPYASEHGFTVKTNVVAMRTLNSICEENRVEEIHFLKIDAEGAEHLVLQGLDLKRFRPWIILVEATAPNSQDENYAGWEPLLKDNGYLFTYFDGLNRFYLAEEHSALAGQLSIPPNFFDDFIKWNDLQNSQELVNLRKQVESSQLDRDRLQSELDNAILDGNQMHPALVAALSASERLQSELNTAQSDKEWIQSELIAAQSERDRLRSELNTAQSGKDRIETELKSAIYERDRIWHELDSTVHSKSYRLFKPLRDMAWFFRRLPASLQKLKAKFKATAFSIIHFVRMLPIFSTLADSLKKRFPGVWARSRKKMLKVHQNSSEQSNLLSSALMVEDEQYFLNLIQDEIAKRKNISK